MGCSREDELRHSSRAEDRAGNGGRKGEADAKHEWKILFLDTGLSGLARCVDLTEGWEYDSIKVTAEPMNLGGCKERLS